MKLERLARLGAASAIALGTMSAFPGQAAANNRYFCAQLHGVFRTFIHTSRGQASILHWVNTIGKFDPRTRCILASKRFQRAYDNGALRHIKTGEVDNYPVLCGVPRLSEVCNSNNVLVTLPLGSDRHAMAQQLLDVRSLAASGRVIELNPEEQVETYVDGELAYDLAVIEKVVPVVEEALVPLN